VSDDDPGHRLAEEGAHVVDGDGVERVGDVARTELL
jgi:hypothetical protein